MEVYLKNTKIELGLVFEHLLRYLTNDPIDGQKSCPVAEIIFWKRKYVASNVGP